MKSKRPRKRGQAIHNDVLDVIEKLLHWRKQNVRKYRNAKSNLYLGRLFSLGGIFTAYFAELIAKKSKDLRILVDCPVMFEGRKQPLYPDILLIDSRNNLKGVIEVKIDFGMVSDKAINDFCKNYENFFKSAHCKYQLKDEWNECVERLTIKIPKKFPQKNKVYMLLTSQNDHGRLESYEKLIKAAGFRFISILRDKDIRNGDPKENFFKAKQAIQSHPDIVKIFSPFLS